MNDIAIKLKTLRVSQQRTQQELADYISMNTGKKTQRGTISNYENGRRQPNLDILKLIAQFYNVGLDYFGIKDSKNDVKDLLARATELFKNNDISQKDKQILYEDIMRLYLKAKEHQNDN